jgi:hypothetical protein
LSAGLPSEALAGADAPAHNATKAHRVSPYRSEKLTDGAKKYYIAAWGLDRLKVSSTASGNLIRFSYRVIDPKLSKPLGDVKATPVMIGQRANVALQIPVMEKVGQLRQSGVAHAEQEYWMVFSNKGNLVKPGDRVNVVIGTFHADGLMVE